MTVNVVKTPYVGCAEPTALRYRVHHRCTVIEDESPATGLIHVADREQSDVIVFGANGHSTLAGRVLGSTSYSLTHRARRPVIVVPATWSQPAAA